MKIRHFAGVAALLATFFVGNIIVKKDLVYYALRNYSRLEYKIRKRITRQGKRPIVPPVGWRKEEAEGRFTLYLPPDFERLDGAGLDIFIAFIQTIRLP